MSEQQKLPKDEYFAIDVDDSINPRVVVPERTDHLTMCITCIALMVLLFSYLWWALQQPVPRWAENMGI